MKKKILLILTIAAILITGCSNKEEKTDKIRVTASFYPLADFAEKIGGDQVEVTNLLKSGNAHGWEPSTKDMKNILEADLVLVNGAGFESWLDKLIQSNPDLSLVDSSKNIDLIEVDHGHEEDHDHDHEGHDHGDHDPHIWLSLKNALIQMDNIKEALVSLDPDHKDYYEENYLREKTRLEGLDASYRKTLEAHKGAYFVVPHEAFAYLAKDYGLNQLAIEGINSDSEPNISQLKEIVDLCREKNIETIFYEYGSSSRIADTIAAELGAKVSPISTIELVGQKDLEEGLDYGGLMELNLKNLAESLQVTND